MTLLATVLETLTRIHNAAAAKALEKARELLAPKPPIPRNAVENLLRRALRNGAWRNLTPLQKALLVAAARAAKKIYRSPHLVEALREIWLAVEMATTRGRAIVAALASLLAKGLHTLHEVVSKGLETLIAIGVQVLNNPQLLRTY